MYVNVNGFMMEVANGLAEMLLKLPKLKEIELIGYSGSVYYCSTILTGICEYIKNYESALQLKVSLCVFVNGQLYKLIMYYIWSLFDMTI